MPFKLSPSSISLMNDCIRCFWLEKHEIWKRPQGPFPSLPNGMDRILKKHFDFFRDKGELPPELIENDHCFEMKLFGQNEQHRLLLEEWRNARKGLEFRDDKDNIFMGAVDNVLVKDGKLIVLDYKTRGYALKEYTHKYYQNQLDIYTYLLQKNGFNTEDFAFLIFYVPNNVSESGEFVFDTTLLKIPINVSNAEFLFEKALRILNRDCPTIRCKWCENVK